MNRSPLLTPRPLIDKLSAYARLMRLDRPVGSLLLLWPTLWALWMAGSGQPEPRLVLIFIAGVFVMRAAGCVINDYADRHWDGAVERTRLRPLATGELGEKDALLAFAVLVVIALLLLLQLDMRTILLSIGALAIAVVYPFTKRVTQLPQMVLGLAFSWGIPMAFMAHQAEVPAAGWWLLAANFCWVVAYDTFYALADRDDDLKVGIKSTAILFGDFARPVVGLFQAAMLGILAKLALTMPDPVYALIGLAAAALSFAHQHWLAANDEPQRALQAFLGNTWTGAYVFFGIVLAHL